MKTIHIVVVDGVEVDIFALPEDERKKLVHKINDTALRKFGYVPEKTEETA